MLAPRQVAGLTIHGGNKCPECVECTSHLEGTDDHWYLGSLASLDIAFYKGATPHKMGVPTGSTLEVNLLLLDARSSGWYSGWQNNQGGNWCCPWQVVWLGGRHSGSWCSYKRTKGRTSKEELSSLHDVSNWIWVRRMMSGFSDE